MSVSTERNGGSVFDALPGEELAVGNVRPALAEMWDPEAMTGDQPPADFRASQMNLVMHLGLDSTPRSARAAFDTALRFSRRYPCRLILLCPRPPGSGGEVAAKIYGECFIGRSRDDMTCTEAIILTYPLEQRAYLENQASIMLESDLPVFYWPQRISEATRLGDYRLFLREAHRIVIDSAIERPETVDFAWPRPEIVHDLAYARVLPVRQSVGHFLSYVPPAEIARGLRTVEWRHRPEFAAEARVLGEWSRRGLADCAAQASASVAEVKVVEDRQLQASLASVWSYGERGRLSFALDFAQGTAQLQSSLGCEQNSLSSAIRLLPPESALAEALFF